MPELNEQTRLKIESKSEKFRTRDIRVIDSTFDAEYFAPGGIYFLNTQKLGSDKLLTQKSNLREYTIWETIANSGKSNRFYSPSESMGGTRGELVPAREVRRSGATCHFRRSGAHHYIPWGQASPACIIRASFSWGGSSLPRASALRNIPKQAVLLK